MFEIIEEIRADTTRIGKEKLLRENRDNKDFYDTMLFVFNPFITTGLSAKKINKRVAVTPNITFNCLQDVYEYLKHNNTGTDQSIANIQNYIAGKEHQSTLVEIFTKELTIGITSTTINKIWGDVIPTFGVMLAERYDENMHLFGKGRKFIISQKLDGLRCVAISDDEGIRFFTRQGKPYNGFVDIEKDLSHFKRGYVYDGELLARNPNNLPSKDLFRLTGSIARSDGIKHDLIFNIFDMIPLDDFKTGYSKIPCFQRKAMLEKQFANTKCVANQFVVNRYVGDDQTVIDDYLAQARANDEEGIMINLYDEGYECRRTKSLLKYKKFNECDARCIGVSEGQGRLAGTLGYITCEFMAPDNKVYVVECGSGFTDEQRRRYWENPKLLIGKIVQIQYFEFSQNRDGEYSLRFPVWLDIIRTDKDDLSRF